MPHSLSSAANFAAPSLGTEYLGTQLPIYLSSSIDRRSTRASGISMVPASVLMRGLRDWMGSERRKLLQTEWCYATVGFLLLFSALTRDVKLGQ